STRRRSSAARSTCRSPRTARTTRARACWRTPRATSPRRGRSTTSRARSPSAARRADRPSPPPTERKRPMSTAFGGTYSPDAMPAPVVGPGEFVIAAVGLDHGHIYGMCEGLIGAGATLKWVYDPDPAKVEQFVQRFGDIRVARSEQEVLDDDAVHLVAGAAVTSERAALGLRVIAAGKDYFTDKAPLTTLDQLAAVREATAATGRKYAVYYSERIHVETAVFASQLIEAGAIGRVVQVMG